MTLVVALFGAALVHATQVSVEQVPCPLDRSPAKVFHKLATDTFGGWDSDLASYSMKGQWRGYAVSTCVGSLFTVYGQDMAQPVPEALRDEVQAALAPWVARFPAPHTGLETWHRYAIAADVYRALGRDAHFLGRVYHEGSLTVRDAMVGVYAGLDGPRVARELLTAGDAELAKDLDVDTRRVVLHNLAKVAHRGGFGSERDAYLAAFEALGPMTANQTRVLGELRALVPEEALLQREAVRAWRAWLATPDARGHADAVRVTYLVADLERRLGNVQAARRGYSEVADAPSAPEDLKELATFLLTQP